MQYYDIGPEPAIFSLYANYNPRYLSPRLGVSILSIYSKEYPVGRRRVFTPRPFR